MSNFNKIDGVYVVDQNNVTLLTENKVVDSNIRIDIANSGSMNFDGTALDGQVLQGATFYSDSNVKHAGTMVDLGEINETLAPGGSYELVGSGHVDGINITCDLPSLDSITITENGTYNVPENLDGYNEINVDVPAIELDGNAEESQVLENATFYSNSDEKKTGTMINRNVKAEGLHDDEAGISTQYSTVPLVDYTKASLPGVSVATNTDNVERLTIRVPGGYYSGDGNGGCLGVPTSDAITALGGVDQAIPVGSVSGTTLTITTVTKKVID